MTDTEPWTLVVERIFSLMSWTVRRVQQRQPTLTEYLDLTSQMVAARVPRKLGHTFIQTVNIQFPFNYRHLKRSRPVDETSLLILLGPSSQNDSFKLEGVEEYERVQVPAVPPQTREQYEAGCKIWPMVFHECRREQQQQTFGFEIEAIVNDQIDLICKDPCEVLIIDKHGKRVSQGIRNIKHPLGHPVMNAIEQAAQVIQPPDYLCTDCIVLCRHEPCLMCAMALLHSRVAAVVYVHGKADDSPFEEPISLQSRPGLNHYYKVYEASDNKRSQR